MRGLLAHGELTRPLLALAWPHRRALALGSLAMVAESCAMLAVPWIAGLLAAGVIGHQSDTSPLFAALLALLTLQALLRFASAELLGEAGDAVAASLKTRLFDHVQALPLAFFHERRMGDVIALFTNDAHTVAAFVGGTAVSIPPMVITAAGAVAIMAAMRPELGIAVALVVPLFYLGMKLAGRRLRPLSVRLQDEEAAALAVAQENLALVSVVKLFGREAEASRRYRDRIASALSLTARRRRIQAALGPAIQLVSAAGIVGLVWIGASDGGLVGPGELVSFLLYALLLTRPIGGFADLYGYAQGARGAMERLDSVFRVPTERSGGVELETPRGEIAFEGVSFAYPGRGPALQAIDLRIQAGETIALVGPNGAGKSTLLHLLTRLQEPVAGRITIDQQDVAGCSLESLRRGVGVVPQQALLFHGGIGENIAYGRSDATAADVEAAARAAGIHEFVSGLPQGYDTPVGDRGVRLSGGQQQRVALARALLKDPPILILDEPTAMLDTEAESAFLAALLESFRGRTMIFITHGTRALAMADRIVHMKDGRIERIEPGSKRVLRAVGD